MHAFWRQGLHPELSHKKAYWFESLKINKILLISGQMTDILNWLLIKDKNYFRKLSIVLLVQWLPWRLT